MNADPTPSLPTRDDAWSALFDGEVAEAEWSAIAAGGDWPGDTLARYQLIGDALRAGASAVPVTPPGDFLAGLQRRLAEEPRPVPMAVPVEPSVVVRGPAANDGVFRWKLAAGFASLAAVMAVAWGLVGTAPAPGAAPVLAQPSPAAPALPSAQPVLVSTPQGPVVRDARLEQLLADHRQFAGQSALQGPTGFIRNATYDASER